MKLFQLCRWVFWGVLALGLPRFSAAQVLDDRYWENRFGCASLNSVVTTFDFMANGDLLAIGAFKDAGGDPTADNFARWDGVGWHGLDTAVNDPLRVTQLLPLPNGDLIVGGPFNSLGGDTTLHGVARWDGSRWRALGTGLRNALIYSLYRLPNGDILAGGRFNLPGQPGLVPAARWNGTTWQPMGSTVGAMITSFIRLPTGEIIAGRMVSASQQLVVRWDSVTATWQSYGNLRAPAFGAFSISVDALALDRQGALVAGGSFSGFNGLVDVAGLARWDGTTWQPIAGGPINGSIHTLLPAPNGDLYIGGNFFLNSGGKVLARWDGTNWFLGNLPVDQQVFKLGWAPNGDLVAAGDIRAAGNSLANDYLVHWDGSRWSPYADTRQHGIPKDPSSAQLTAVQEVVASPNGGFFAGGNFWMAGVHGTRQGVAYWNGNQWNPLNDGSNQGTTSKLAVAANGDLVAFGSYTDSTASNLHSICKTWSNGTWQSSVTHTPGGYFVTASTTAPNGDVYAAFVNNIADSVARLQHGRWQQVAGSSNLTFNDLAVAANGDIYGALVYETNPVVRWNASQWQPLPAVTSAAVPTTKLRFLPNGDLILATNTSTGAPAAVVRWDGTSWQPVGRPPFSDALALTVLPGGQLLAGGYNRTPPYFSGLFYWNGSTWRQIGSNLSGTLFSIALTNQGDIVIGGSFTGTYDRRKCFSLVGVYHFAVANGLPNDVSAWAPAFSLFPNPAQGVVQLENPPANQAEILDPLGHTVRRVEFAPGTAKLTLSLQDLIPGFYLVRCGGQTRRLVVE